MDAFGRWAGKRWKWGGELWYNDWQGNHYGSHFAAQKAGAAFRQRAKASGNPMDFSRYHDWQGKLKSFWSETDRRFVSLFYKKLVRVQGATKRPRTFLSPILTAQQAGRHFASQKPMELNPCINKKDTAKKLCPFSSYCVVFQNRKSRSPILMCLM